MMLLSLAKTWSTWGKKKITAQIKNCIFKYFYSDNVKLNMTRNLNSIKNLLWNNYFLDKKIKNILFLWKYLTEQRKTITSYSLDFSVQFITNSNYKVIWTYRQFKPNDSTMKLKKRQNTKSLWNCLNFYYFQSYCFHTFLNYFMTLKYITF